MTTPLAMLAVASPAPSGPASGASAPDSRGSRDGKDASRFSDIMARQRAAQDAAPPADGSRPAAADAPPPADPRSAAAPAKDGVAAGDDTEDDKNGAEALADAAPTLAQQALAIAAMALQLQGGPANAAQAGANGQAPAPGATGVAGAASAAGTPGSGPASATAQALLAGATAPADGEAAASPDAAASQVDQAGLSGLPAMAVATGAPGKTADGAPPKAVRAPGTAHEASANGQLSANDRTADAAVTTATQARGGDADAHAPDDGPRIQDGIKAAAADKDAVADAAGAAPRNAAHAQQADMTQVLANVWQAPAAPANAGATPAPAIHTPVGQAQWGTELGGQLVLMTHRAGTDSHTAELRLDPPDLGPLRVTIKLNDGVAEASFVSAHAAVRQAVESALPQLQQSLAQAGISLGQANVSDHGAQAGFGGMHQGSDRPGQGAGQMAQSQGDTAGDTVQIAVPAPRRANAGLVDTFA